ncbi:MAG: penicillin-binding protein [Burkholderiales bacterium 35-55-47]|jgi:penicillin-binding protein 1A|nr:MAG: penicillin-binding protein [Burkholderiales bacterium 35-55-47]OYZ74022.1 MAG: penicillin-binding protein [Burkholderiales bacterium 24-55-52]OZB02086.1 MAG: penicillin-binding protein [Burkholderiales bacterium 39-55-53]
MATNHTPEGSKEHTAAPAAPRSLLSHVLLWTFGIGAAMALVVALLVAVALAMAYPQLPDVSDLADYRPKLSMRVYSVEGTQIGEFGEEKRNLTPFKDIPKVMKDAVLAIEDARFYQHGGVDYIGLARAALANLGRSKSQGASTITMQVARNVYLSSEKTFTRKIYEILLTSKLEHMLTKDQIFEIYLNQIYLGNRAYGFAAASEAYFGKPLKNISIAEAAMLAGLPKAPSAYNPIVNPKRARARQLYIIERMEENGFITAEQAAAAKQEELKIRTATSSFNTHADYVAEMARQLMYAQYGPEIYTRGLNVYTTVRASDQQAAYFALRRGIMDYERRQHYRGPERFINLPTKPSELEDAIDDALIEQGDKGDLLAAVVLEAAPKKVRVMRQNSEVLEITGDGLQPVQSGLSDKAAPNIKLRPGALVRITKTAKGGWEITQLPEVEGAFVSIDPRDGAIHALVGGFDFNKNKFNHVTQAWRQPGSSFKPFIYSAALEKGFTPMTVVNDAPLFFDASVTGGAPWEPKNYDGTFEGPMTLRKGLAKSKNMISIRVLQAVGAQNAQDWIAQFGFDPEKHPPYLTMALGAGSATPMQMVAGYSVFANGGYRVNPYLITKVTDQMGKVLSEFTPPALDESARAIDERNAFVMTSLLQEVTRSGTAARAQATLKRNDIYGKTGTTNDSMDAWFAGYHPTLTAVTWIGYDTPRKLGDRETGGGLSLPVWISYMQHALQNVPIAEPSPPAGLSHDGGDWAYTEFSRGGGVINLGMDSKPAGSNEQLPANDEKKKILDLFKN